MKFIKLYSNAIEFNFRGFCGVLSFICLEICDVYNKGEKI